MRYCHARLLRMRQPSRAAGFTIIETLIATTVFSVILLVITVSILQFSKEYYKGIIVSSTQSTARTIVDDVSRSIQFNGGPVYALPLTGGVPNPNPTAYCVGSSKLYSFALNQQVTDSSPDGNAHQGTHGIVSNDVNSCDGTTVPVATKTIGSLSGLLNGRELLGQHMRLAKLSITGNGSTDNNLYSIDIKVVYGDDDLLTTPSNPATTTCKSTTGSQFCAVSELKTTVQKRVD